MSSDIEVFLKYQHQDVRYPEIRTAFLTELEPTVIGKKVTHYNYAGKPTVYTVKEVHDVFDTIARYVVVTLHYFTPKRNLERIREVRLIIDENGLNNEC